MFSVTPKLFLFAVVCLFSALPARADGRVLVEVDRAQILRLDQAAGSIIIGNPAIADAAVQDVRTLVLTGKSVGSTNLIVLDSEGKEILNQFVDVLSPTNSAMTMYRGPTRQSYSCSPVCEPTVKAGDSKDYFENLLASTQARNALAVAGN